MTPNPNAYNITYDDGTVSPMLRLKIIGGEVTSSASEVHGVYEETMDSQSKIPILKHDNQHQPQNENQNQNQNQNQNKQRKLQSTGILKNLVIPFRFIR